MTKSVHKLCLFMNVVMIRMKGIHNISVVYSNIQCQHSLLATGLNALLIRYSPTLFRTIKILILFFNIIQYMHLLIGSSCVYSVNRQHILFSGLPPQIRDSLFSVFINVPYCNWARWEWQSTKRQEIAGFDKTVTHLRVRIPNVFFGSGTAALRQC